MTADSVAPLTHHQQKLLDASVSIRNSPTDRIDFLHTVQCQCGIPYKNPGDDVHEWDRRQGKASLRIEAGSALNPKTGEFVKLGLPFGEKPRLVLIHLATEAVRRASPVIDVEGSMTAFARSLGMETNGQQLRSLQDQLARLAAATVRLGVMEDGRAFQVNTQFVSAFDLWFPKEDQRVLWSSTVRLSEEYFQTLGQHAVPLDHRAVAALASSAMALDVYVWLAQRLHRVPSGRPQFVDWNSLHEQFGQGFARIRDFRRKFLQTLNHVGSRIPNKIVGKTKPSLPELPENEGLCLADQIATENVAHYSCGSQENDLLAEYASAQAICEVVYMNGNVEIRLRLTNDSLCFSR